jgi:MinD-like ATPase involved in chromosome partitioning or flagellar assembly
MRHELHRDLAAAAVLRNPRIVVASGMQGTGVSTVTKVLQHATPTLNVVDGGARWTDILDACTPGFAKLIAVTTHDIVSVSSTYALVKMVRDRFPGAPIEVLVNLSEARDALKTYERIQLAASHFLQETVGYAGAVPYDGPVDGDDHVGNVIGDGAVFAIQDIAIRLDEELSAVESRTASRAAERRMIQ